MSFQIYNWLEKYVHEVVSTFGYRIWFIGVQGSYARGEATEESDIDVVLILDTLLPADLRIYRGMLNRLPYREKITFSMAFVKLLDSITSPISRSSI